MPGRPKRMQPPTPEQRVVFQAWLVSQAEQERRAEVAAMAGSPKRRAERERREAEAAELGLPAREPKARAGVPRPINRATEGMLRSAAVEAGVPGAAAAAADPGAWDLEKRVSPVTAPGRLGAKQVERPYGPLLPEEVQEWLEDPNSRAQALEAMLEDVARKALYVAGVGVCGASFNAAMYGAAIAIDKMLLLRGQATSITGTTTQLSMSERAGRIVELLRRGDSSGDAGASSEEATAGEVVEI